MSNGRPLILMLALLVVAAALPVATAQVDAAEAQRDRETKTVTFYAHTFGVGRDSPMPVNTEYPWGEEDFSIGLAGTAGCGAPGPVPSEANALQPSCDAYDLNELWVYSTAGFVDVTGWQEWGSDYGKFHNERGQTKDVFLDTTKDIEASVYMSADWMGFSTLFCSDAAPPDVPWPMPCWNWDPGMLPDWQVEATLYMGVLGEYGGEANTAPPIREAYEAGDLQMIAQGVSEPEELNSFEPLGNPTVHEIQVNLGKPQVEVIPKESDFVLRFQWWSNTNGQRWISPDVPLSPVAPFFWNLNGGEFYPNRFMLPVKNAFDVEYVVPQFVHDKLVILGIINTPWGSYDVDPESTTITVTDASGDEVFPESLQALADYSVAHGGHYKPVNVTYVWDYKQDGLAPGDYEVTVSAANWQGSASSECTGAFTILKGGKAGPVTVGECGIVTATQDDLEDLQEGAAEDAATDRGAALTSGEGSPSAPAEPAGVALGHPAPLSEAAGQALIPALMGLVLIARPRRGWRR